MGLLVSLPQKLEPAPASALHEFFTACPRARWPGALFGVPPGCVQSAFWRCDGSEIGRSADASSPPEFICITEMRLPVSGTSLS
jgi:hypothetical protein